MLTIPGKTLFQKIKKHPLLPMFHFNHFLPRINIPRRFIYLQINIRDIHNTLIPAPSLLWMLLSCTKAACANRFASCTPRSTPTSTPTAPGTSAQSRFSLQPASPHHLTPRMGTHRVSISQMQQHVACVMLFCTTTKFLHVAVSHLGFLHMSRGQQ